MTSRTSVSLSMRRAAIFVECGFTGCGPTRPCSRNSAPDLPRKSEVGGMVAVQVADLMALDPKPELAATARTGLHARPGGDLFRNLLG